MILVRDAILTLTVLGLIYLADNQPRPVKDNQVNYCVVDVRQSVVHPMTGERVTVWGEMYAPCDQQDRFRFI